MKIKVAGVALNQTPMDWQGNRERIGEALETAARQGASVVCFPELCLTGYGCEDAFFSPQVQRKSLEILLSLAPLSRGRVVTLGLPMIFQGCLFNVTAVLADGKVTGFIPKKYLAGDGVHYEPRWFKPWPVGQKSSVSLGGEIFPFGDLYFNFSGLKLGLEICEEAWVAQRPGAMLARRGVDVILNPSASHFAFGKLKTRQGFVREGSRAFNVGYVYANLLGNESGRIIFDGGVLIADGGEIVAQGQRFSYRDFLVTTGLIDVDRNRVTRSRTSSFQPDFDESHHLCIDVPLDLSTSQLLATENTEPSRWESSANLKEEEFSRAVALGLFDFIRKSHQFGLVVSLSGGVDSAAVTLLGRLALDFAELELGLPGIQKKLCYIPFVQSAKSVQAIAENFLTTVYQGTVNSSEQTLRAASEIAGEAGARFYNWNVDDMVNGYLKVVEVALGEKITWDRYDSTRQNIQARCRGPGVWMLANIKNALLAATSNRSEAAVGYATMDGDTCGGLSPIGGIDKNFLRQWSHWMCDRGPESLHPYSRLRFVLAQAPTAELRPQDQHQTDEEDLMPYDVLDSIERLAVRDKKSPAECWEVLAQTRKEKPEVLKNWVIKFFRMWSRNQWKRERYAPAFHLDDESLDPKTWCRFPILSSGFEEELQQLEKQSHV